MIDINLYEQIRHLYSVEGMSQRAIARELGISRNTVRRYCHGEHVPWEKTPRSRSSPVTDPIRDIVAKWLKEDKDAPCKQRHTAERIHQLLVADHNFAGGKSTIRKLVKELKAENVKAFVPLEFDPGEAAQVDWGEATFYLAGKKTTCYLFCYRLCYSSAPFVVPFPSQRQEAFLAGHVMAFNFFGGVPKRIFYDNLKTAVKEGWGRYVKAEQSSFVALRGHYAFRSVFCNPRAANEKGLVENLVGLKRRNIFVPVPRVDDYNQLQQETSRRCLQYIKHHHIRYKPLSVQDAFTKEQAHLLPLPLREFDYAFTTTAAVQLDGLAKFQGNRYSVPIHLAGRRVTIKGHPLKVDIHYRGDLVASYERCYRKGQTFMQAEHYFPLLVTKPRSLYNAAPLKNASLPAAFARARDLLLAEEKDQELAKIIKLTLIFGLEAVETALAQALTQGVVNAETVRYLLDQSQTSKPLPSLLGIGPRVEPPDLSRYDQLLGGAGR